MVPNSRSTSPFNKIKDEPSGKIPIPVLLFLFAIALPVHFYLGSFRLTALRLLLLLLIIPMVINLLRRKYGKILWVDYMIFLHFIWVSLAIAINEPGNFVKQFGSIGIEFIGGYMLGRAYIQDFKSFRALTVALVLIACCSLPFAVYEALTGNPVIVDAIRKLPGITSVEPMTDDWYNRMRYGLYRTQVFAAHPIHYGLFAVAIFPFAFIALRNFYTTKIHILLSLLVGFCVFFSLSSGPVLGMVVQLGLISWAVVFQNTNKRWLILTGICVASYIFVDIVAERSPIMVFLAYASFSPETAYGRALIFEWGMKNVWSSPIIGIGSGDWQRIWWMSSSVDNFWLLTTMRYGIPSFLFLIGGWLWALWKIGSRNFDSDPTLWQFRRAWVISVSGITIVLLSVHIWDALYSFVFFLFGAGVWLVTTESRNEKKHFADTAVRATDFSPYTRFPKIQRKELW